MKDWKQYAHVFRAIEEGEQLQWRTFNVWGDICAKDALSLLAMHEYASDRFRIKPKTININGHEFDEPMRVAPSINTHYWVASVDMPNMFGVCAWEGSAMDNRHMKLGLCHATKEAAAAHGRALASFTEVKE